MDKKMLLSLMAEHLNKQTAEGRLTAAANVALFEKLKHLTNQLDEPQKVVVPKFVADWIEEYKQSNNSLIEAMDLLYESHFPEDCEWLTNNSEIFARAWLDGYEVEQEKLYTVEIPNPNSLSARRTYLGKVESAGKIQLRDVKEPNSLCQLTEAEIRQDFDWAWQAGFAKEVE